MFQNVLNSCSMLLVLVWKLQAPKSCKYSCSGKYLLDDCNSRKAASFMTKHPHLPIPEFPTRLHSQRLHQMYKDAEGYVAPFSCSASAMSFERTPCRMMTAHDMRPALGRMPAHSPPMPCVLIRWRSVDPSVAYSGCSCALQANR